MSTEYYIPNGINLTEKATNYLKKKTKTKFVLISMKKSGCSGFKYIISDIEDKKINDDTQKVFLFDDIYLVINKDEFDNFKGIKIDYKKSGLNEFLFFENPNTQDECGCGESFSIKK